MTSKSHIRKDSYMNKSNFDELPEKQQTPSISTDYQSDSDELSNYENIDNQITGSRYRNWSEIDENESFSSGYSEILFNLQLKVNNLNKGQKACDRINEIFKQLCTIENKYVEKLRRLKDQIELTDDMESIPVYPLISSFKSYISKMEETHSSYLDSISNECVLETNHKIISDINKEIEKLKKEVVKYKTNRFKHMNNMKESYSNAKNAVSLCLDATHQAPSIKTSVHKAIIPIILNFININNDVYKYDDFNHFLDINNKVDSLINSLDELEKKRFVEIKDTISKFMIYETAKIRNLQYDLNSLIEVLNNFYTYREPQVEILSSRNDKIIVNDLDSYSKFSSGDNQKFSSSLFPITSIQPPPYRVISKIEDDMQRYINGILSEEEIIPLKEFDEEIQSSLVRQVFCDLLSKFSTSNCVLKSKYAELIIYMFREKLQHLVDMVNSVLLVSERQADFWCGYSIIKLSDKFYIVEGEENHFLWTKIFLNNYWKNITFWEECLTIILSMDFKAIFETSSCLEKKLNHIDCLPSTEEPQLFYKWMLKYGIRDNDCKSLIHRVCAKFKVPQSYITSLIPNH